MDACSQSEDAQFQKVMYDQSIQMGGTNQAIQTSRVSSVQQTPVKAKLAGKQPSSDETKEIE